MQVAIAGAGYVGLVTGACLAELGHEVRLYDLDAARVAGLAQGICPIHEPGLPERLVSARITYHTRLGTALAGGVQVLLACVGTPPGVEGEPDLTGLYALARDVLAEAAAGQAPPILAIKSTVPVGTARELAGRLEGLVSVVSNPEFLREGTAIADFFRPDRVVVGGPDAGVRATVAALYAGVDAPLVEAAWEGAELIKYATNAFLAMKIGFVGELAALCSGLDVDVTPVLAGLGLDRRVGRAYLQPGPGYGGSCLPKDLAALTWMAAQAEVPLDLLPAAQAANARLRERLLVRLAEAMGGLAGKRVAIWGLAFKAGTDDVRGSAALDLLPRLLAAGATVRAHDPVAAPALARAWPGPVPRELAFVDAAGEALDGADGLLVLTEWPEYAAMEPCELAERLGGAPVVDARHLWQPARAAAAGLVYHSLGRPTLRGGV